jgi:hypothetical protein
MSAHRCPICGDPSQYPIWLDKDPPDRCPTDLADDNRVRTALECPIQTRKARTEAIRRRCAPECFAEDGAILPGKLDEVITRTEAAGFDAMTGAPRITPDEWRSYAQRRGLWTVSKGKGQERHIEVKITGKIGFARRWLEELEHQALQADKDFWVYLVTDANGRPSIRELSAADVRKRFVRVVKHYWFDFS